MQTSGDAVKTIATNRKAHRNFSIIETYEAGIALTGTEIQSARRGRVNLSDAWVEIRDSEAFLIDSHISEWEFGNIFNHEPRRDRKLLLHKAEIRRLDQKVKEKGYTITALSMYLSKGRAKVEIGLAKGKTGLDKREDIKERDIKRSLDTARKSGRAGDSDW
ncbi:MAG TPA: SsrA-binding protein SmpB [Bacillota bacterium]|nr:MAG: SsrA-binding protein [Firmicutes bacterium ADurb.Bin153]HNV35057.1 SsrA-binding protein SmpB [Bacillota bacterium]HPU95619.1 SsrA-binding protein SmpB [Bacillota bacterium]